MGLLCLFLRKKIIRIIKEVRYVSKIDVRHNAFVDTTTILLTSLAQYIKKNIYCHHDFSLPAQKNCLLKFKLCICIFPSYGFSLSALKCTNLTKANTPTYTLNVERPKNTQPSSNDLLIDLLIVHRLANRSTRPNYIGLTQLSHSSQDQINVTN